MPTYDGRHHAATARERIGVPRLNLDVMSRPRHHDVRPHRRARTERDYRPRRPRDDRGHHHHTARAATYGNERGYYGYDSDYLDDYASVLDSDMARVRLFTHDSHDPFSCTCYPRASSKAIPSMMYDQVRCPHPEHNYQPAKQDYFAYPWSVQTYRPTHKLQHGYKQGQVKPPSAVTAPPFHLYTKRNDNPSKGDKPPPYTAPVKAVLAPLLSARPSDRRLRRADRKRVAALPPLDEEEVSPFDSISQVAPRPPSRAFRPDSLRLRTVDTGVRAWVESDLRAVSRRALSTPRARPPLDADGFPQTPTRIFRGEYVDPRSGQKYEYDIKYGKLILDGKRRLKTV